MIQQQLKKYISVQQDFDKQNDINSIDKIIAFDFCGNVKHVPVEHFYWDKIYCNSHSEIHWIQYVWLQHVMLLEFSFYLSGHTKCNATKLHQFHPLLWSSMIQQQLKKDFSVQQDFENWDDRNSSGKILNFEFCGDEIHVFEEHFYWDSIYCKFCSEIHWIQYVQLLHVMLLVSSFYWSDHKRCNTNKLHQVHPLL